MLPQAAVPRTVWGISSFLVQVGEYAWGFKGRNVPVIGEGSVNGTVRSGPGLGIRGT